MVKFKFLTTEFEERFSNYYRQRWDAIDNLADYLVGAEIPGDYLEFGVAKGMTFSYAYKIMSPLFKQMRFIALDSFEGLPKPKNIDNVDGYTSSFYEGQYAYSEKEFLNNIKQKINLSDKIITIGGWFDQTLTDKTANKYTLNKIAAAWIDCDLYESTVPVLNFITTRLSTGSVILFDDWHCFRNLPNLGEQKACQEWLIKNPQIKLHKLFSFGWHGEAFTVGEMNGVTSK
jgi:O-methyltransferase